MYNIMISQSLRLSPTNNFFVLVSLSRQHSPRVKVLLWYEDCKLSNMHFKIAAILPAKRVSE